MKYIAGHKNSPCRPGRCRGMHGLHGRRNASGMQCQRDPM